MSMIQLTKIDEEYWRFTLYESERGKWIADFTYSPKHFVDLSMLIELTDNEKIKSIQDRRFLIDLSERIRDNYADFFPRALIRKDYTFNDE